MSAANGVGKKLSTGAFLRRDFRWHWRIYLMLLPVIAFYLVFCYAPMYGLAISFTRYNIRRGLFGSTWVGLKNFQDFFQSYYFFRKTASLSRWRPGACASLVAGFRAGFCESYGAQPSRWSGA